MSDKLQHECAVAAVFGVSQAARRLVKLLYMLQHRGPQASGIVTWVKSLRKLRSYRAKGLVRKVFSKQALQKLTGNCAIGHNRYSTCGGNNSLAIQPHIVEDIAGASNGDLPQYKRLRRWLFRHGMILKSFNDGEAITALVAYYLKQGKTPLEAIRLVMEHPNLRGAAYSCVFIINGELWAFRDPLGFRPLALARYGKGYMVASENCAFRTVGASFIREVKAGEIIRINKDGSRSFEGLRGKCLAQCIFEYIYFARPDSIIFGESVSDIRKRLGRRCWKEFWARYVANYQTQHGANKKLRLKKSDYVVISVPDSANSIALGVHEASGIRFDFGFIRHHQSGRGFLENLQGAREDTAAFKYNPDPAVVGGKIVIVVDDSIVRGTTSKKLVRMLYNAGARKVIMLIGSPMVIGQCFFGIDTPTKGELIANRESLSGMIHTLELDDLYFLSVNGLKSCVPDNGVNFCKGCFTGKYPCQELIPADKLVA